MVVVEVVVVVVVVVLVVHAGGTRGGRRKRTQYETARCITAQLQQPLVCSNNQQPATFRHALTVLKTAQQAQRQTLSAAYVVIVLVCVQVALHLSLCLDLCLERIQQRGVQLQRGCFIECEVCGGGEDEGVKAAVPPLAAHTLLGRAACNECSRHLLVLVLSCTHTLCLQDQPGAHSCF